jgi:ribonuclease PH
MNLFRIDGRANHDPRLVNIKPSYLAFAEGSTLIEVGQTKLICSASVERKVPPFLKGKGRGWVTAEYSMLPRSTLIRKQRETGSKGLGGRTQEIQRLIGRSLRSVVDLDSLGENSILIDCDVIQADGGTRTAAITGSFVALHQALLHMVKVGTLKELPLKDSVAAISVGIIDGEELLDLCYVEDFRADVDFNIVMTKSGHFVEVQGTAEGKTFSRKSMDNLLDLAVVGIEYQMKIQDQIISGL